LLEEFFYRPDEDAGPWSDPSHPGEQAPPGKNELVTEYLAFELEGESFAFPIHQVREIVRVHVLTEIPGGGEALLGLINLRGEILPAYDIRRQLRLEGAPRRIAGPATNLGLLPRTARILIIHGHGEDNGVLVDQVIGVARLTPSNVEEPAPRRESERNGVMGLGRWEGRVLVLLDSQVLA
jgi:purine-binding chemotaxis protein CheW